MSMNGPTLFILLAFSYACNAQFWGGNFQKPIGAQTRLVGWPTYNALTNIQTSYVFPGNSCGAGVGCGGGSFCNSGFCNCPTGYLIQAQSCVVQTAVAPAPFSAPAPVAAPWGANFQQPIAAQTRLVGWPTYNALTNIQTSYVYPGNPCSAGIGCGGGSFCYSGSCNCPSGYIVQAQSCVVQTVVAPAPVFTPAQVAAPAIVAIGSPCGRYGGCSGGASCLQGICGCGAGYIVQAGGCVVAAVVRPVIRPAYPIQGVPGPAPLPYVLAAPVPIGSPCSVGMTCGYGASCFSGTCGCSSSYYVAAGGCRRRRR